MLLGYDRQACRAQLTVCRPLLPPSYPLDSIAAAARAIKALDLEIGKVEDTIRGKERWETVRTVRADLLHQDDEATQATETVVTSKLVGAEKERAQLELLLSRRRILTGL